MFIDEKDLKLLLEKKREQIGNKPGWELFLTGLLFFLPIIGTDFKKDIWIIDGIVYKTVCIIIGIILTIIGLIRMIKNLVKKKYNHNILFNDIVKLEKPVKKYSLVAIKNTFAKFANKFLLYYDEQWDCKFFINFSTLATGNDKNIIEKLSNMLNIDKSLIETEYITKQVQVKYSTESETMNTYEHIVYKAVISEFTSTLKKKEFEIDGKKFYWMTIQEMEKDLRISEVNSDVVALIKSSRI